MGTWPRKQRDICHISEVLYIHPRERLEDRGEESADCFSISVELVRLLQKLAAVHQRVGFSLPSRKGLQLRGGRIELILACSSNTPASNNVLRLLWNKNNHSLNNISWYLKSISQFFHLHRKLSTSRSASKASGSIGWERHSGL